MGMRSVLSGVDRYYSAKVLEHGATPRGVDWNSAESQRLRFMQFGRLWRDERSFSVADLGCGYGALYDYLRSEKIRPRYLGVDVSRTMVAEARRRHAGRAAARFKCSSTIGARVDYVVASGIFNVKLEARAPAWRKHVVATLRMMNRAARKGIAFNCLTRYSDADRMRPYLFYADPLWLFDLCKTRFGRNVALLHDYGLYEFTIVVRKETA